MKTRFLISLGMVAVLAVAGIYSIKQANAASSDNTTADATCTVIASISITKTQDLQFGNASQSDVAKTVDPAADTTNSAAFTVAGQASTAYDITLPADATITMITGAGGTADEQIDVDSFASSPSGSGNTGAGGSQTLYVGATRAAILATQTAGSYTASFTVTVAYQ